jgi:hypothetical protein
MAKENPEPVCAYLPVHKLEGKFDLFKVYQSSCGPGSSVSIATAYGLDGPGVESSGFDGRGVCVLASGTQDREVAPDRSRQIFPAGKIHSMPSFGRGSKIICPMLVTRTTKGQKGQKGQLWYKKNPGKARFSAPVQTGPGAHPASCTMDTGSFPRVESGRGVTLTPHSLLVPWSKNRVELYLYFPQGPS